MVSCSQVKDVAYFNQFNNELTALGKELYDTRIKPKDLLSISVVSSEPEASRRFNLVTPQILGSNIPTSIYTQPSPQPYLVNNEGDIDFPVLGTLPVKGLNTEELKASLEEKLSPYFSEEMPIITVRIMNYSINVLGEVAMPGKFNTLNERVTIFEGLAMAGDMTIYGKRDNVKVLRENEAGEKMLYTVNLNDKNIFNSPVYFLQQNDVVYVEPNQSRANSSRYGAAENFRISALSILISLATLGTTIFSLTR